MNKRLVAIVVLASSIIVILMPIQRKKTDQLVVIKSNPQIEMGMERSEVETILTSERLEFRYEQSEARIHAIRRSDSGFIKEGTQFFISFDDQDRVTSIESRTFFTGP